MLTIKNLNFAYGEESPIFSEYNISLDEGDLACLVGRNGAGKTTLLTIISGLLYSPDMSIDFLGKSITQQELKDNVIYVPTEPSFYGDLTVKEFVDFVKFLWDLPREFGETAELNIANLSLSYGNQQRIESFSLGMKYKLYLAIFLAIPRRLLLLDEPLNSLDIESRSVAVQMIKTYIKENKAACLFSSHFRETVDDLSTRIIALD